jgi:hypothetical protein
MWVRVMDLMRVALGSLQSIAHGLIIGIASVLAALSVLCIFGILPWPQLALFFGGQALPNAGMWVQLGLTTLTMTLLFFVPANARMARLERSHRSFAMGMEDVARAYRHVHMADRAGVFALSSEFDAMRARLDHARSHPDLQQLEPELLQLAATMSLQTRDLARAYSDDKVERARGFLRQRQEDVHALTERVQIVRHTCDELRRWLTDIEAEERQAQVQIKRLESDLAEILPALGYTIEADDHREANVVALPKSGK